jgi:hypothetical protein
MSRFLSLHIHHIAYPIHPRIPPFTIQRLPISVHRISHTAFATKPEGRHPPHDPPCAFDHNSDSSYRCKQNIPLHPWPRYHQVIRHIQCPRGNCIVVCHAKESHLTYSSQIADRLCASIGQDILDCLFSRSTLEYLSRRKPLTSHTFRPFLFFGLATLYNGQSLPSQSFHSLTVL